MSAPLRDPVRRIATLWSDEIRALASAPRTLGRIVLVWAIETIALLLLARLLPGVRVDGAAPALATVIVLQVLNATIRPIVVYLILPLAIVTLGLILLLVNGAMLWLAVLVVPGADVDGYGWALLTAILLALANASVVFVLDLGEEGSFYRRLSRQMVHRGRSRHAIERPGYVIVQIDGLGHDVLLGAIRTGRMPNLARWLRDGTHRLTAWECALPSQTSASQAGILFGDNAEIPAFRWYEKDPGRLLVSNRTADAAEIERRRSRGTGLLSQNGSSIGNLFSGDARRTVLTMSTIRDLRPGIGRRSRDFLSFFINPYATTRVLGRMGLEIAVELRQARRQRLRDVLPRVDRGGAFPVLRAVSCVLLRDLAVSLLVEDMERGVAVTYADLVAYDEVAHHAGPERPEALGTLDEIDLQLGALFAASLDAPRPYRFVVLSDHGQSVGATFRQRRGRTLEETVRTLMAGRPSVEAATGSVEGWGHLNAFLSEGLAGGGPLARSLRWLFGRRSRAGFVEVGPAAGKVDAGARPGAAPRPDVVVCASGNLGLIYFPDLPGRATRERIEDAHPGLVERLAADPWIGFVLVRSETDGALVLGQRGRRRLADDTVDGEDPLAPFGPRAADHLRRLDSFTTVGDLVVNSAIDPATGEVAAFEELVGSHGGLGGPQTRPFLLHPADLIPSGGPLVGAPAVFETLVGWVRADAEPTRASETSPS